MKRIMIIAVCAFLVIFNAGHLAAREIVESRGGKVKVVKYGDGTWELLVNEKPYFIKGVLFNPVKIGESPDQSTMRDWMYYDDNQNGLNDVAYETWLDKNNNNKMDADELIDGDFKLMKDMGVNTIRLYHL
ncbi:MAG: hypothetical protein ABIH91_00515, partial [Candidatus Omnitrophota bacterium]